MRLFISYAHTDVYLVRQLVEILRSGGHDPWFDHRLIVGGKWETQLQQAITACDAFVYALTPESVASEWCLWEYGQAVQMGKPIIPVLLQSNTKLPTSIQKHQYADFTNGPTPDGVARLLGGLLTIAVTIPKKDLTGIPANPKGTPAQAVAESPPKIDSPSKKTNTKKPIPSKPVVAQNNQSTTKSNNATNQNALKWPGVGITAASLLTWLPFMPPLIGHILGTAPSTNQTMGSILALLICAAAIFYKLNAKKFPNWLFGLEFILVIVVSIFLASGLNTDSTFGLVTSLALITACGTGLGLIINSTDDTINMTVWVGIAVCVILSLIGALGSVKGTITGDNIFVFILNFIGSGIVTLGFGFLMMVITLTAGEISYSNKKSPFLNGFIIFLLLASYGLLIWFYMLSGWRTLF